MCWLLAKSVLWILKAVWKSAVGSQRLAYCIYQLHFAAREIDARAARATDSIEVDSVSASSDASSSDIGSSVSEVLATQPIEAAAFRPRRNRVRSRRYDS